MSKIFRKAAHEMKPLAAGLGSCIASDRIPVDGMKVGYMYRELANDHVDSGWRFFAGDETVEYSANPDHFSIYDVNTIANYDPAITAVLETPPPCAFERDSSADLWKSVSPPDDEDGTTS